LANDRKILFSYQFSALKKEKNMFKKVVIPAPAGRQGSRNPDFTFLVLDSHLHACAPKRYSAQARE